MLIIINLAVSLSLSLLSVINFFSCLMNINFVDRCPVCLFYGDDLLALYGGEKISKEENRERKQVTATATQSGRRLLVLGFLLRTTFSLYLSISLYALLNSKDLYQTNPATATDIPSTVATNPPVPAKRGHLNVPAC